VEIVYLREFYLNILPTSVLTVLTVARYAIGVARRDGGGLCRLGVGRLPFVCATPRFVYRILAAARSRFGSELRT